jgi:hypothetical protein
MRFFAGEAPGDKPGQEIEIGGAKTEWSNEDASGYEIDIQALPDGVRFVRFYNSW